MANWRLRNESTMQFLQYMHGNQGPFSRVWYSQYCASSSGSQHTMQSLSG